MTGPSTTLSSLVFHISFAVFRLALLWLVISVLLRNYRRARAELYRPAVDLQDYEMVELFLRRLKMWMGLSRAKEVNFLFHIYSWTSRIIKMIKILHLIICYYCLYDYFLFFLFVLVSAQSAV